jgi:mono/diheme cytochrome c family protein
VVKHSAKNGGELFRQYCASCHGATARGDGPLAEAMRRRPPNLTEFRKRNSNAYSSDLVYRIIDGREKVRGHGGPDMPVWGDAFSRSLEGTGDDAIRARIQALVDYLESIQVPVP